MKLRSCCILLDDSVENMMMYGLTNPKKIHYVLRAANANLWQMRNARANDGAYGRMQQCCHKGKLPFGKMEEGLSDINSALVLLSVILSLY
jgi:hypothetical protein